MAAALVVLNSGSPSIKFSLPAVENASLTLDANGETRRITGGASATRACVIPTHEALMMAGTRARQ